MSARCARSCPPLRWAACRSVFVKPLSVADRKAIFDLIVQFDQVLSQSIGYALVRPQFSIGRLPACGPTRASTGLVSFGEH